MASSANRQHSPEDGDPAALWNRNGQFEQFNKEQTKFKNEILMRYEYVCQQNQMLLDRQHDLVVAQQSERLQYEKALKKLQRVVNSNPYFMVLIDGDGMIFLDEFLRDGEKGGRRAAMKLQAALQDYIENEVGNIPHNVRIVCRIYVNVRGLGDVLVRTGVIEEIGHFGDFVRGFTQMQAMFDFIDVGSGKDRADEKIIESFKFYSDDYRCRRLLFGCSHDNGYARILEKCSGSKEVRDKVVLLEGVPFEKELAQLEYDTKKFPGLFREAKLVVYGSSAPFTPPTPIERPKDSPKTYSMRSGLPTRLPPPKDNRNSDIKSNGPINGSTTNSDELLLDSPISSKILQTTMPRTPSSSTIASDAPFPAIKPTTTASWASKAALPPPPTPYSPLYKPANREEIIARNRTGQRVDPPAKTTTKPKWTASKKSKCATSISSATNVPLDLNAPISTLTNL